MQPQPLAPGLPDVPAVPALPAIPGLPAVPAAGSQVWDYHVRRVGPSDGEALTLFYAALSADSRLTRFLGVCSGLSDGQARHFCDADHEHEDGFVAIARGPDGVERHIVGHLCLEPAGPGTEELAVVVADAWQRHGIGRALFEEAIDWASHRGIRRIVATAFSWNAPVLRLLSSAPDGSTVRQADGGVVLVEIQIQPRRRERSSSRRESALKVVGRP